MAKVFLSAGHGGSDPGAVAYGLKEKDINLNTLLACNEVLVKHGVTTILSRSKDENDPVRQEVKEANASGASLFLFTLMLEVEMVLKLTIIQVTLKVKNWQSLVKSM